MIFSLLTGTTMTKTSWRRCMVNVTRINLISTGFIRRSRWTPILPRISQVCFTARGNPAYVSKRVYLSANWENCHKPEWYPREWLTQCPPILELLLHQCNYYVIAITWSVEYHVESVVEPQCPWLWKDGRVKTSGDLLVLNISFAAYWGCLAFEGFCRRKFYIFLPFSVFNIKKHNK